MQGSTEEAVWLEHAELVRLSPLAELVKWVWLVTHATTSTVRGEAMKPSISELRMP